MSIKTSQAILKCFIDLKSSVFQEAVAGADPGRFLGGGALVSCSTSTPISHIPVIFFFRVEYQLH